MKMKKTRDHGFGSLPPCTHRELRALSKNLGIRLNPFKSEMAMAIDERVRVLWAERRRAEDEAKQRAKEEAEAADE